MALAILELSGFGRGGVRFQIDTGTNKYYRLKVGRSIERRNGIDWVGELVYATRMSVNDAGGGLLNSSTEIAIPADRVKQGHAYVQLFTFKTPEGRSPAFSRVVKVPFGSGAADDLLDDAPPELTMSMSTTMTTPFKAPRTVACRTATQAYAYQTSWMDLLGEVVKVATPVVMKMLGGGTTGGGATAGSSPAAGATAPDFLAQLLQTVLGGIQAAAPQNAVTAPQKPAAPAQPANPPSTAANTATQAKSQGQSVGPVVLSNRFANGNGSHGDLSRPFIFGIDDAAIATLLGPFIKILPDLMNSANKKRVEMKQAQNALIGGIMSDINRRLILDKLIEAQKQPAAAQPGAPDLNQLIQLLQQAGEASKQQSLPAVAMSGVAFASPRSFVLSSRAVLSFITAEPVKWNGSPKLLFAKNQPLQFNVKFAVGEPVPPRPLPKALLKLIFKDSTDQTIWLEKTVRQKDLAPNAVMSVPLSAEDAARLPVDRPVAVLAELRWPAKSGPAHQALGGCDAVFVNQYFLTSQGAAVSPERELADMNQFRAFWNKVWESPSLDAARGSGDQKQYLWELDVNAKYTVLLAPDHDTNGLMETKLLRAKPDPESLTNKLEGRMKAGIELSVAEVNKLLTLWDAQPLDAARLEAISTAAFAKANAGELVRTFKLRGRASERGLIWVVPVFKLFELTLGSAKSSDATGQIVELSAETVRFPLPVSARVIGLKSQS
jgi:hypothetical protein